MNYNNESLEGVNVDYQPSKIVINIYEPEDDKVDLYPGSHVNTVVCTDGDGVQSSHTVRHNKHDEKGFRNKVCVDIPTIFLITL